MKKIDDLSTIYFKMQKYLQFDIQKLFSKIGKIFIDVI